VLDLELPWTVEPARFPLARAQHAVRRRYGDGRAVMTIVGGKVVQL